MGCWVLVDLIGFNDDFSCLRFGLLICCLTCLIAIWFLICYLDLIVVLLVDLVVCCLLLLFVGI